jgi:hypothetical protein
MIQRLTISLSNRRLIWVVLLVPNYVDTVPSVPNRRHQPYCIGLRLGKDAHRLLLEAFRLRWLIS